jgi:hypothetical protein
MWMNIDEEKRKLSAANARKDRALKQLRLAKKKLEEELKQAKQQAREWKRKYEEERKKNEESDQRIIEIERQRDRYRDMIFKPNRKKGEGCEVAGGLKESRRKRKRGAQKGHKGYGRKRPEKVDEEKRLYLERCPTCESKLNRSKTTKSHTVEDIPALTDSRSKVTRYQTEVQWCPECKKSVKARAVGVIPKSRLGINVLLYVLVHKYMCREPWVAIVDNLYNWYGLHVSKGSLVDMMHRAREWMGERYDDLLEQIRSSPVKYADETSWRREGVNLWLWGFFTDKHAYYTIEESRGKGVPERVLKGSHPEDVLVRDDYGAYMKLSMLHQSCWSHLLRESHERDSRPEASPEVKKLHEKLKTMFLSLEKIIEQPFVLKDRKIAYRFFKRKIQEIIDLQFEHDDSKEIQTRINNQKTNLITALLHENVPLTNNHSERNLRNFVVARKISGGSRSNNGAKTHAVLMSIIQSIRLQKLSIVPTLKNYLLEQATSQN